MTDDRAYLMEMTATRSRLPHQEDINRVDRDDDEGEYQQDVQRAALAVQPKVREWGADDRDLDALRGRPDFPL